MTGVLIGRRREARDVRHRGQTMSGRAALSKPRREGPVLRSWTSSIQSYENYISVVSATWSGILSWKP